MYIYVYVHTYSRACEGCSKSNAAYIIMLADNVKQLHMLVRQWERKGRKPSLFRKSFLKISKSIYLTQPNNDSRCF